MKTKIFFSAMALTLICIALVSWQFNGRKSIGNNEQDLILKISQSPTFIKINDVKLRMRKQTELEINTQKNIVNNDEQGKLNMKNKKIILSSTVYQISQENIPLLIELKKEFPEYYKLSEDKRKYIWHEATIILENNKN